MLSNIASAPEATRLQPPISAHSCKTETSKLHLYSE